MYVGQIKACMEETAHSMHMQKHIGWGDCSRLPEDMH